MNILKDNKETIKFLRLEILRNKPKTYFHNPLKYKIDKATLQFLENKATLQFLENKATWELKAMIKALELPISSFLNDDEDNLRLKNAKKVLKDRKNKIK